MKKQILTGKDVSLLIFAILLFLLASCRELVTSNFPDFDPVPVVHCILVEGEPLELRLSWAAALDTTRLKFIEDAQIRLLVNGEYLETLAHQQKGLYVSSHTIFASVRYQCEIAIPGCETIIASDSLPVAIVPEQIQYIPIAGRDEEGLPYPALRYTFANNPNERRYYEAVITEILGYYEPVIDLEYALLIVDPETGEIVFVDPETGEIINVTYRFVETDVNKIQYGPVTDPVMQGEGLPIHVFSNELIKGNEYTITLNFTNGSFSSSDGGEWIASSYPTLLELRSVSYDYYRYAKQKYLYEINFEPEFGRSNPAFSLYSNIDKGYGIFAGYSAILSDTLNHK